MSDNDLEKLRALTLPYYLHPSDGSQITICPIILKGDNYHEWDRSMRNNLRAKNKHGFLDGTIARPTIGTTAATLWVTVNSTLVGWIYGTLDPTVRSSVTQPYDVKDMWDDLHDRFLIGNGPRIHELTSQLSKCTQNGQSVVVYFGELRKLWDELVGYSKVPACTCAAATELAKEREEAKVHTFLVGLDSKLFSNLVSNLLMMEPLPSLRTTFAKVVTEERHLTRAQEVTPDVIGFAAQGASKGRNSGRNNDRVKSNVTCGHCGKPGHEKDSCYQIIGYPYWFFSENRFNISQGRGRGGGRTRRGGGRDRGGRVHLANAAASSGKGSPKRW